jgi:hypothetical protein
MAVREEIERVGEQHSCILTSAVLNEVLHRQCYARKRVGLVGPTREDTKRRSLLGQEGTDRWAEENEDPPGHASGHSVPDREEYAAFRVDWFEECGEQQRYGCCVERYSGAFSGYFIF